METRGGPSTLCCPVWSFFTFLCLGATAGACLGARCGFEQGVAYKLMNGPWIGCWVRLGYNPAADPAARAYQVLDVRFLKVTNCRRGGNAMRGAIRARECPPRAHGAPWVAA